MQALRMIVTGLPKFAASIGMIVVCQSFVAFKAHGDTLCAATGHEAGQVAEKPAATRGEAVQIGDKVNLAIFERAVRQEDKWGPQAGGADLSRSFIQRAELSGERTVQENGALALPLLGQIAVEGCSLDEAEKTVAKAFEQAFHRPAFATVLSIEHNPIFIVGPVKSPGSYKYSAGMTVLHAIALSGGINRAQDAWLAIEAVREESKAEHLRVNTARALARAAVLRAERDGSGITIPVQLAALIGNAAAAAAVEDEKALRSLALSIRQAREAALRSAAGNAASELEAAKMRLPSLDASIKLRSDRLQAVTSLNSSGIASKAQLVEVQTALVDMEAKRQDALAAVAATKQKRDQANAELMAFNLEYQSQRELEISTADRETRENWENIAASQGILTAMLPQSENSSMKAAAFVFEIHRHTPDGLRIIPADEITELKPGDLIRIKAAGGKPSMEKANTAINTSAKW